MTTSGVLSSTSLSILRYRSYTLLPPIPAPANSNSADFLKEQTNIQREIKISFEIDYNEGISVTYQDNGPGLSKDIINPNQIFEPFYTTKKDKDGNATGTGLGMWIVKEIIDEYKGSINFITVERGFKLKIILPTN